MGDSIEERRLQLQELMVKRQLDLDYLKLTVIIVLLIVIIFYITCKFNAKKEKYDSPQLSAATHEQKRSDQAFDLSW